MKLSVFATLSLVACSALAQENTLSVSAGAAYASRYAGSARSQATPIVGVDYQMANGFFASSLRGIGYQTGTGIFQFSGALGYRPGRDDQDRNGFTNRGDATLRGMGDVDGSATATLGATAMLSERISVNLNLETPLSKRENGTVLSAAVNANLLRAQSDQLTATLSASAANRDYMQTWFGVTAAQSARTGFRAYAPKAGADQVGVSLAWTHLVGAHWSFTGSVSETSLVGDARDSPLTRRRSAPGAALYASYRF